MKFAIRHSSFLLLIVATVMRAQAPDFFTASDTLLSVADHVVYQHPSGIVFFAAGMSIDCDGGPHCYHPEEGRGMDNTRNAGRAGHWWALATDDGTSRGEPLIQDSLDPAPGYYISMTSLSDPARRQDDPVRYVNAEEVPYFVLPPSVAAQSNVCKGDLALVLNAQNGQHCWAIFADVGPAAHLGEGSVALAQALAIPADPRSGGAAGNVWYFVFPGSSLAWPVTEAEKEAVSALLLQRQPALGPFLDSLH